MVRKDRAKAEEKDAETWSAERETPHVTRGNLVRASCVRRLISWSRDVFADMSFEPDM